MQVTAQMRTIIMIPTIIGKIRRILPDGCLHWVLQKCQEYHAGRVQVLPLIGWRVLYCVRLDMERVEMRRFLTEQSRRLYVRW